MATLRTQGLRKRFGHVEVLHGIDLDIADGEFVVLVGPSGCGKSTLLRMIAGLEEVSDGELWIGGTRADHLPPQKRDVAMVFQSYALFPHMTVRENIAYGPKVRRESTAKVEEAAELLNLTPYLERYPRELSGGQRQRVAMGRALQREPRLFLFDEPLSNLDAQLRVAMRAEIKALHERLGNTIVYVTHDQIEAMTMADRIVVMRDGRIVQEGAPLEIYDRPANIFVAGFIGSPSMSFLRGRIESGTLRVGDLAVAVEAPEGEVAVGVRPDAFSIVEDDGGLEVEVQVIEPMGPETHVLANVVEPGLALGQGADAATDIRAVVRRRVSLRSGDRQRLRVDPEGLHLFHLETGERLEVRQRG